MQWRIKSAARNKLCTRSLKEKAPYIRKLLTSLSSPNHFLRESCGNWIWRLVFCLSWKKKRLFLFGMEMNRDWSEPSCFLERKRFLLLIQLDWMYMACYSLLPTVNQDTINFLAKRKQLPDLQSVEQTGTAAHHTHAHLSHKSYWLLMMRSRTRWKRRPPDLYIQWRWMSWDPPPPCPPPHHAKEHTAWFKQPDKHSKVMSDVNNLEWPPLGRNRKPPCWFYWHEGEALSSTSVASEWSSKHVCVCLWGVRFPSAPCTPKRKTAGIILFFFWAPSPYSVTQWISDWQPQMVIIITNWVWGSIPYQVSPAYLGNKSLTFAFLLELFLIYYTGCEDDF